MVGGKFGGSGLLSIDHACLGRSFSCKTHSPLQATGGDGRGGFSCVQWSTGSPYVLVFLVRCGEEIVQRFVWRRQVRIHSVQRRPTPVDACHCLSSITLPPQRLKLSSVVYHLSCRLLEPARRAKPASCLIDCVQSPGTRLTAARTASPAPAQRPTTPPHQQQ